MLKDILITISVDLVALGIAIFLRTIVLFVKDCIKKDR